VWWIVAPAFWWSHLSDCLWSVFGPLTSLLHAYGMHCPKVLFLSCHYQYSGDDLKPFSAITSWFCYLTVHWSPLWSWKTTLKITELYWTESELTSDIKIRVQHLRLNWMLFDITVEVKLIFLIWSNNKILLCNIWSELHVEKLFLLYLHRLITV